jgi:hypothetical protein
MTEHTRLAFTYVFGVGIDWSEVTSVQQQSFVGHFYSTVSYSLSVVTKTDNKRTPNVFLLY